MDNTDFLEMVEAQGRLYPDVRDYMRARPGHGGRRRSVVAGIQEQDSVETSGDLLAQWDVVFYPSVIVHGQGDVVAHRVLRRSRYSRTVIVQRDEHPVIMVAQDVTRAEADAAWRSVTEGTRAGTLESLLVECGGR
ncbi:hypothetical protein [Gordonia malaquae]|uniref:hypothetical protein n=2 Tax=Gordoniaceae TaxID=85026 RepID=UPI0030FEFB24